MLPCSNTSVSFQEYLNFMWVVLCVQYSFSTLNLIEILFWPKAFFLDQLTVKFRFVLHRERLCIIIIMGLLSIFQHNLRNKIRNTLIHCIYYLMSFVHNILLANYVCTYYSKNITLIIILYIINHTIIV